MQNSLTINIPLNNILKPELFFSFHKDKRFQKFKFKINE